MCVNGLMLYLLHGANRLLRKSVFNTPIARRCCPISRCAAARYLKGGRKEV
jgi:hypothetical protein